MATDQDDVLHCYTLKDSAEINVTGDVIGQGAYGKVFKVEYYGTQCAGKEIHTILLEDVHRQELEQTKATFLRECRQCCTLRHPNIVQFLGLLYPPKDGKSESKLPVIVMELMHSSLRSYVEQTKHAIPYGTKLSILQDVARGLRYIHHQNPPVVHRDLSPNNVLLTNHLVAKLSDLGVAKAIKADNMKTMTKVPGTSDFMPPEALEDGSKYGPPLDIFSYGGVSLYLVSEQWPILLPVKQFDPSLNKSVALSEIERRQCNIDKIPKNAEELKHLIISCLDDNPNGRPTAVKVLDIITELICYSVDQEISKLSISAESYHNPWLPIADPHALNVRKPPASDLSAGRYQDQYSGDARTHSQVTHAWSESSTIYSPSTNSGVQGTIFYNRQSPVIFGSTDQSDYSSRQPYQQPHQQYRWPQQQYQWPQQQQQYQQQQQQKYNQPYQKHDQNQSESKYSLIKSKPSEWCKSSGCHFPALPECGNFCFPCYKASQVKNDLLTQVKEGCILLNLGQKHFVCMLNEIYSHHFII